MGADWSAGEEKVPWLAPPMVLFAQLFCDGCREEFRTNPTPTCSLRLHLENKSCCPAPASTPARYRSDQGARYCQAHPACLSQASRVVIEVHAVGVPEHDAYHLHAV